MKLYLVNFHYPNSYSETISNMPVGPGYVLEAVEQQGIPTRYWEYSLMPDIDKLIADIKNFAPTLIGCSFYSHHYTTSYSIINRLADTGIPVVCGGVHVNITGSNVLEDTQASFLIIGEGEESLPLLLKTLEDTSKYSEIPGLVYRDSKTGKIRQNSKKPLELSEVSYPKYQAFSNESYTENSRFILSSRGCPYACTFCSMSSLLSKKWRSRPPEHIISEMEYWAEQGQTKFNFIDDNLTLDNERIVQLCRLIAKSPYHYHLATSGVRINNVTFEILQMMRDCGFDYLSFGIESGNDRVLKEIKKGITLKQINRTLEMVCKLDFRVKLYFIVNNRTETYQEAHDSFLLSRRYPIRMARFSNLVPYPGTYDYDWIRENGRLLYEPEDYLNRLDEFRIEPLYDGPGMTIEERFQIIKDAQREVKRFQPGGASKVKHIYNMLKRKEIRMLFQKAKSKFSNQTPDNA